MLVRPTSRNRSRNLTRASHRASLTPNGGLCAGSALLGSVICNHSPHSRVLARDPRPTATVRMDQVPRGPHGAAAAVGHGGPGALSLAHPVVHPRCALRASDEDDVPRSARERYGTQPPNETDASSSSVLSRLARARRRRHSHRTWLPPSLAVDVTPIAHTRWRGAPSPSGGRVVGWSEGTFGRSAVSARLTTHAFHFPSLSFLATTRRTTRIDRSIEWSARRRLRIRSVPFLRAQTRRSRWWSTTLRTARRS